MTVAYSAAPARGFAVTTPSSAERASASRPRDRYSVARPTRPSFVYGSASISARNSFSASASRPARARAVAQPGMEAAHDEALVQPLGLRGLLELRHRLVAAARALGHDCQHIVRHDPAGIGRQAPARGLRRLGRPALLQLQGGQDLVAFSRRRERRGLRVLFQRAGLARDLVDPGQRQMHGPPRRVEPERRLQRPHGFRHPAQTREGQSHGLPGVQHAGAVRHHRAQGAHRFGVLALTAQGERALVGLEHRDLVLGIGEGTRGRRRRSAPSDVAERLQLLHRLGIDLRRPGDVARAHLRVQPSVHRPDRRRVLRAHVLRLGRIRGYVEQLGPGGADVAEAARRWSTSSSLQPKW